MDREMQRWVLIGAVLGVIFLIVLGIGVMYFTVLSYTPEQKAEMNTLYAENCTRCMAERHINCTAETVQYSPWGAVCGNAYVDRNCTTCRRI